MADAKTIELLKALCEAPGVPGFEAGIAGLTARFLDGVAGAEYDNVGNVYFELTGSARSPRVLLPAHMDETGFMVTHIDDKGFLRFLPLGGWFDQVLLGQRVKVLTGKGELAGVIGSKPPHLLTDEDRNKVVKKQDMFIDVGAVSAQDARQRLGIRPGDPIVPDAPLTVLAGGARCLGRAFDDRVGLVVMVLVLQQLKQSGHPNTVVGAGTVQEEVGTRGAKSTPAVACPDACIVLEVGIPGDVPGIKPEETQGEMGKGPMICVLDSGMVPHVGMRDFIVETAEAAEIPYQFTSLSRGATDGREIQHYGKGVPSLYLGVPARYIHSHSGIVDIEDIGSTTRLVVETLKRLDDAAIERIRRRVRP